jgi:hypothetical protein
MRANAGRRVLLRGHAARRSMTRHLRAWEGTARAAAHPPQAGMR